MMETLAKECREGLHPCLFTKGSGWGLKEKVLRP